jgi:hypothetical protein
MSKHTPGPWELSEAVYKDGFGTYRRVEQVPEFGDVVASVCIRHALNHTLDACGDANARLIAAAPDLLETIRKLRAMCADFGAHTACEVASAAIFKATGEQT